MSDKVGDLLGRAAWARDPRQAARLYRQALEIAEPGGEAHVQAGGGLGTALEKLDKEKALAHYRQILAKDLGGEHHYGYTRLPILLEKRGEYDDALEVIRLAVRRRVPADTTFRRRAWRIADKGERPRPFVPYRPFPWRTQAHERMVELLWYYGELSRDRKAWGRAAQRYGLLWPGSGRYAEAQTWLGHCLEKMKRVEEAMAAYERAAAHYEAAYQEDPGYAYVGRKPFDRLIVLYERGGELERALATVRRALAVIGEKPPKTWWTRAGRIAEQVGEALDREGWEAGFRTRTERVVEGLPEEQQRAVKRLARELAELAQERRGRIMRRLLEGETDETTSD